LYLRPRTLNQKKQTPGKHHICRFRRPAEDMSTRHTLSPPSDAEAICAKASTSYIYKKINVGRRLYLRPRTLNQKKLIPGKRHVCRFRRPAEDMLTRLTLSRVSRSHVLTLSLSPDHRKSPRKVRIPRPTLSITSTIHLAAESPLDISADRSILKDIDLHTQYEDKFTIGQV
jgi:hypothetical protein